MRRLELAIHEALSASAGQRRAMVVDAINEEFSPQLMIQSYNQVRSALPQQQGCALLRVAAQRLASPYSLRPVWGAFRSACWGRPQECLAGPLCELTCCLVGRVPAS